MDQNELMLKYTIIAARARRNQDEGLPADSGFTKEERKILKELKLDGIKKWWQFWK